MRARPQLFAIIVAGLLLSLEAPQAQAQDGFLFRSPQVQMTVRAGPVLPRAQGDIFGFMTSELTLERSDFRAPSVAGELAFIGMPRLDFVLGLGWAQSESSSEFALWQGAEGDPIAQTTRLRTVPLTMTARVYPLARGRSVSRLAWVPTRTMPYAGVGAGLTWYDLRQEGEFLDTQQCLEDPETGCSIFYQEFGASGQAPAVHGVVGIDHWFTPRVGLNIEGRYTHSSAPGKDSFRTYDSLDLSGVQATLGLTFRW